jgi:adenosylhomocysteine nucleosidase
VKILVTFAVDAEFAPWRKRYEFRKVRREIAGLDSSTKLYRAESDGIQLDVLLTGIGWSAASAASMAHEIANERPDLCISTGLAGALKPNYRHGDVLAAARILRSETSQSIGASVALLTVATKLGAKPVDAFVTNGGIVSKARLKQAMSSLGDAIEMESFHVLSSVRDSRIPSIAVRAISDTVDEDLPINFAKVVNRAGQVRWANMVGELGMHPGKIRPLLRFAGDSRRAAEKLADFLEQFVDELTSAHLPPAVEAAVIA